MANNTAKIAKLQTLLESGATSVVVDGVTVSLDVESLRRELRRLQLEDDTQKSRRPVVASIKLS